MSGRKYSQAMVENAVREAIRHALAAEQALEGASSLVAGMEQAALVTESLRPSCELARKALAKLEAQVRETRVTVEPGKLGHLTPPEISRRRDAMAALRAELDEIATRCREGNAAAGVLAEIARVHETLEQGAETLEPWTRDTFAGFSASVANLLAETRAAVASAGSARGLEDRIRSTAASLDEMQRAADGRRVMAAEREYIATALARVCSADLGFAVTRLSQSGPLDDLVLEVDTFAYGLLHFRLQLDGMIRSESPLVAASCPSNFKLIEDRLRSLGVLAAFRYEADQRPVTLTSDAKRPPAEARAGHREGAV